MIRLCTQDEALKILNEPETVKRLGMKSERMTFQPWVSEQGDHKLLFVFWLKSKGVAEMHIAAPKKSILKSRLLACDAINFVFGVGASKIVTNCPKGKISNMAVKLGMKQYKSADNQIYYEVSKWELEQQ